MRGLLPVAVWQRHEAKRARNRLHDKWKRDPWQMGRTIDLGIQFERFSESLNSWGHTLENLPPAVVDWLAWRFQRLMVDRKSPAAWAKVLSDRLPAKINAAGVPPQNWGDFSSADYLGDRTLLMASWSGERLSAVRGSYKRRQADRTEIFRAKEPIRPKLRGRPRKLCVLARGQSAFLANLARENHALLQGLYANCQHQRDKDRVLCTLAALANDPGSAPLRRAWSEIVRCFGA